MPTFSKIRLDARRRTYVRLIGEVRHALNEAFAQEASVRGLTKAHMAARLGKHPSFITRKMNGTSNMTLETLADLAYSMDRPVQVVLPSRRASDRANDIRPADRGLSSPPPKMDELLVTVS